MDIEEISGIPEIEIKFQHKNFYYLFFGDEVFYLFLNRKLKHHAEERTEPDFETGEKHHIIIMNPDLFPSKMPQRYWKPILAHEIRELKKGTHEEANEYEALYCQQYLGPLQKEKYLEIVSRVLGSNHSKTQFLRERFNQFN